MPRTKINPRVNGNDSMNSGLIFHAKLRTITDMSMSINNQTMAQP